MSGKRKEPIESISDSSSSSSDDESAPTKPKSKRDRAHLAFQKSPNARLKSLFQASSSSNVADIPLPKTVLLEDSVPGSKLSFDRNAQSRSTSFDITSKRMSSVGDWDALDEDLVAVRGNDSNPSDTKVSNALCNNQTNTESTTQNDSLSRTMSSYSSTYIENEEKETVDRWRGRLWPGKAVISFVRVLTRCQPPFTFVDEKVILGKNFYRQNTKRFDQNGISDSILQREGNNLYPHWKASDLPTVGTYFDNAQAHSSAFFLLIAEESRAALSSQYDEAEFEEEEEQKPQAETQVYQGNSTMSKNKNGWLDGEIASIIEETPLGHLPDACQDPRLGSVWVVSLLIKTSNVRIADTISSKSNPNSNDGNRANNRNDDNISLSGGDVIVIHSRQWEKPILGIIQPWDPDYDIKFGSTTAKLNSALNGRNTQDYIILNIMICVDGGDSSDLKPQLSSRSIQYEPRRSGWATPGSIFPGVQVSLAVLGNTMTYIRECQALLSLRMLSPRLQSAILRPPQYVITSSDSRPSSSLNRILESSKSVMGQQPKHPPLQPGLEAIPIKLWTALAHSFNASQLHALQTIISRDPKNANQLSSPIHLLQGPPGTGKTKTILGILSLFFSGGLPPVGRAGKGQRVVAGASILSNHAKNIDDRQYPSIQLNGGNQQNVNYLNASTERDPRRPRVLICAPSNTAVDELVYRIVTQGIFDEEGVQRTDCVQVTRIGTPNKEEYSKRHQHKYNRYKANHQHNNNNHQAHATLASNAELSAQEVTMIQVVESVCLEVLVETKRQQLSSAVSALNAAQLSTSFIKTGHVFSLTSQQARSGGLQQAQPAMPNGFRYADLRRQVLEQVDIVCCTLSGAGSQPILEILLRIPHYHFDAVIIDEAAQTVEPSSLIPLKFNPQVVVMVGDPCQLPPTIFSSAARQANYGQSLFERLQLTNQIPLSVLATQYRMHPAIAAYPAQRFYNGHLFHGHLPKVRGMSQVIRKPFHEHPSGRFRPLVFHDVSYGVEEYDAQQSVMNMAEGNYVCALYDRLLSQYAADFTRENIRIGIIVPYRGQRRLLVRLFKERYGRNVFNSSHVDTEISTVDGFQGREKDIIIFSCVRAPNARQSNSSSGGSIGFLRDWRRLNVAITRAKHALWIVGNSDWLSDKDPEWNSLIAFIKSKAIENGENSNTLYFRFQNLRSAKNFSLPLSEHLKYNKVCLSYAQERSLSSNSLKSMEAPNTKTSENASVAVDNNRLSEFPPVISEKLPPPLSSLPSSFLAYPPSKMQSSMVTQSLLPLQLPPPLPPFVPPKDINKEQMSSAVQLQITSAFPSSTVPPPPTPPLLPRPKIIKPELCPTSFPLSIANTTKEFVLAKQNAFSGVAAGVSNDDTSENVASVSVSVSDIAKDIVSSKREDDALLPQTQNNNGKRVLEAVEEVTEDNHAGKRFKSGPFQLSADDLASVSKLSDDLFTKKDKLMQQQDAANNNSLIPVEVNHLHKHGHHHQHAFSYKVTQIGHVSSPQHRPPSSSHTSQHGSETATAQPTFVVSSPTHVRALATPSERLRTFYHHPPHQHQEPECSQGFEDSHWFDSAEKLPPTVNGPFGSNFHVSSAVNPPSPHNTKSNVIDLEEVQHPRDRALSTISLSSDSSL